MEKRLPDFMLLDTSFISEVCKCGRERQWDLAMAAISKAFPTFETARFSRCITALWFLEQIGLGKFRKKHREKLRVPKSYVDYVNTHADLMDAASCMINDLRWRLENFFKKELTVGFLRRQAYECLRDYPFHQYAGFIKTDIKLWRGVLDRDKALHKRIIADLIVDTLLRYQYVNPRDIPKEHLDLAKEFYRQIYHCLAKTVIAHHNERWNLSGFGIFHAIRDFWNLLGDPEQSSSTMLRKWDDMLDAELIHFAQIGWYKGNIQVPVLVITCEDNAKISQRKKIQKEMIEELANHGYPLSCQPGVLINLNPHKDFEATVYEFS